jgi:hypothetical protein
LESGQQLLRLWTGKRKIKIKQWIGGIQQHTSDISELTHWIKC